MHCLEYCYSFSLPLEIPYLGVPNSGHGPVCSLLGTGLHISRWAVQEWAKLHLYLQPLPIAHITTWALPPVRSAMVLDSHRSTGINLRTSPPPSDPWKNFLPWKLSICAKKVGTASLYIFVEWVRKRIKKKLLPWGYWDAFTSVLNYWDQNWK